MGTASIPAVSLDPNAIGKQASSLQEKLHNQLIGQNRIINTISGAYQVYKAEMNNPNRPISTILLMGPTGVGKTKSIEAAAESLFHTKKAVVKINCGEFQHSHEIAKLIGSPPGYLGHKETSPFLTQERLDEHHTKNDKLSFVLFDEIEKASDSLWRLMLGIMDKAKLNLGTNKIVDFSNCIITMTSNLGAKEMSDMITGGIGFAKRDTSKYGDKSELDQKIYRTAVEAAKRKFSPEFMNRIDKVVVFRSLKNEDLKKILDLELKELQHFILHKSDHPFVFECSDECKNFLLNEGTNKQYGARELKRVIERHIVHPVSCLVASQQIKPRDYIQIHHIGNSPKLLFVKNANASVTNGDAIKNL